MYLHTSQLSAGDWQQHSMHNLHGHHDNDMMWHVWIASTEAWVWAMAAAHQWVHQVDVVGYVGEPNQAPAAQAAQKHPPGVRSHQHDQKGRQQRREESHDDDERNAQQQRVGQHVIRVRRLAHLVKYGSMHDHGSKEGCHPCQHCPVPGIQHVDFFSPPVY
jgi:hypothetical protein